MKRTLLGALALTCLAGPVAAGPGDPFGGSETGCTPTDKLGIACGKVVTAALAKVKMHLVKCHLVQAGHAFQTGHSSNGFDNAEEECSSQNPTKSAQALFDLAMAKAAAYCDPAVVAAATARGTSALASVSDPDSLDALNGAFFCDATSGLTIAEPGGGDADEAGSIPATEENNRCSRVVAKSWAKLVGTIYRCHAKKALADFGGKPFDTDLCEETPTKGALARFVAMVQKYIDVGYCPPCLADAMSPTYALDLGASALATIDAQNQEIYPCPGP